MSFKYVITRKIKNILFRKSNLKIYNFKEKKYGQRTSKPFTKQGRHKDEVSEGIS